MFDFCQVRSRRKKIEEKSGKNERVRERASDGNWVSERTEERNLRINNI